MVIWFQNTGLGSGELPSHTRRRRIARTMIKVQYTTDIVTWIQLYTARWCCRKCTPPSAKRWLLLTSSLSSKTTLSPHTGQNSIAILNRQGNYSRTSSVEINIERQESNSLDTNGIALAFFPSLASMVSKRKTRTVDQLVDEVTSVTKNTLQKSYLGCSRIWMLYSIRSLSTGVTISSHCHIVDHR